MNENSKNRKEIIMKILVTGGAGYIGSHTNKELNRRGYETARFSDTS